MPRATSPSTPVSSDCGWSPRPSTRTTRGVYHLFYADEDGDAGSDLTFFEYPGAARGVSDRAARIASCGASAPPTRLRSGRSGWRRRGLTPEYEPGGWVLFADPEGLQHELVVEEVPDGSLSARHPAIPPEHALLGFSGVRAYSLRPEASREFLINMLSAEP